MIDYTDNRLSKSASQMIYQNFGFRTDAESVQSLTEHDGKDVLAYECNELGNTDIPETMNHLYDTNFAIPDDDADTRDDYDVTPIDEYIKKQLNTDTYYLVWLVQDWHSCFSLYAPGHIEPKTPYDEISPEEIPFIDTYAVRPDDLLVSDLGYDGQLIATKYEPEPMHGFNH